MKAKRKRNPERVNKNWLLTRVSLLAKILNMELGFKSNNPGDYRRYTVTNPDGSHNYSPSLKAGDMDLWLSGALEGLRMKSDRK